jgi:Tol biopolymer transport system component
MLRLLSLAVLFSVLAAVGGAQTHPFSIHDMLAMDRISDPRVSPEGKLVSFTVSVTDLEKNKRRSDLYLAAVDGSWVRRLTTHDASDSQGRWSPDGKSLYFVSSRSGSSQVWRIALDGGEAEQVTRLPLDVDALEVAPGGNALVFSMAVFPGKTPEQTKQVLDEKEKS